VAAAAKESIPAPKERERTGASREGGKKIRRAKRVARLLFLEIGGCLRICFRGMRGSGRGCKKIARETLNIPSSY
jgi:hypothetical protein